MSEYELLCDSCGKSLAPADGLVSWTTTNGGERGFALTHRDHVSTSATDRAEVRRLVWPNEYLVFVSARLGAKITEPEPLRAILWALAPFVMRHDNPAEMDGLRAASFGQIPGVKPGTEGAPKAATAQELEGGK